MKKRGEYPYKQIIYDNNYIIESDNLLLYKQTNNGKN